MAGFQVSAEGRSLALLGAGGEEEDLRQIFHQNRFWQGEKPGLGLIGSTRSQYVTMVGGFFLLVTSCTQGCARLRVT